MDLTVLISNAELDRFIAEVRARPLAEGGNSELSQKGLRLFEPIAAGRYRICVLPELARTDYFFFRNVRKAAADNPV